MPIGLLYQSWFSTIPINDTEENVAAAEGIGDAFVQYHQTGVKQEISDELVTRLELSSEDLAQVYAFVGDSERAIRAIDVALEERSGSRSVLSMKINVAYDFTRDDPRFVDLMRRAGML